MWDVQNHLFDVFLHHAVMFSDDGVCTYAGNEEKTMN